MPCKKPVKSDQEGLLCETCKKWVHLKCTDLTDAQYDFLKVHEDDAPFFCLNCCPRPHYADIICDNISSNPSANVDADQESSDPLITSLHDSSCSSFDGVISDAHSSDFYYETDESDSDLRGLDFSSLPVQICRRKKGNNDKDKL